MTAIVEFNQGNYRILEDGTALGLEVTLVRTGDTTGSSNVTVQLIEGSATADFDNTPISINFAANETSKTVTIPVFNDPDYEGIENLVLLLADPSWGTEIGSQGAATLEIIDNDSLPIVEFDAASYSVNENDGSVTIGLTRLGDTSNTSTVDLFWNDGSASNGSDFNPPASTTINFAANQTSATVNVPISDDGDTEGTETFFADFGLYPSGATIGNQSSTSIEIVDNDGPAIVELSSGSYSVSENAGMATVALTRTGDTSSSSSVEIALYNGTATSGVDFSSPASSLVNFAANQTSATVDIPITDDFDLEGQENLFLSLVNPSAGSYIGLQNSATLDIVDDDGQSILEFDSSSYSVNEADGLAVATINRSGNISSSSSVEVVFGNGTAENLSDFNHPLSAFVSFEANQSSAKVYIPIINDTSSENNEDFSFNLVNPIDGTIGVRDAATMEIVDDDGPGRIEFESASYSGSEKDKVAFVTLKRKWDISSFASVDVELIDGTASASYDINWFNTTINFAQNQSSVTFVISINDDFEAEKNESLTLVLKNPSGADIGYQSTANLDILDNDGSATVEFDAASYSVGENGGLATVRVERTGYTSASSSVEVLLSERSAANGSDFSNPVSNIVNFAPNQTSATVLIPIAEDIDIEGTEELAVQLVNPDAGTNIGNQSFATLEIVDNDGPAIVEFDSASYSGSEDSAVATVLVTRSGDTSNPSTVGLLLSDGSAQATSDVNFSLPTATINFAANQTSATVDIPVIDDFDSEGTENLFLSLVDPSPGSYIGSQSNATLDIIDNDSSTLVEFDSLNYSVAEDDSYAILNLTRTGNIQYSSTANLYLNDGSASISSGDFNNPSSNSSIDFAPYQTSASVAVPIIDDNEIEYTESFFAEAEFYSGGVSYETTATVEIVDNDGDEVVEFASESYSASEGDGVATIEIKRSGLNYSSTIELFVYDGTALANSDVNFTTPILVDFPANQTSTTVTIPVIDDAEIEGKESLLLSLGNYSGGTGTYIGNQSTATLDIVDNDGGPVVEMESASYSVSEGDGVAVVSLSRSGNISSESTVNLLLTDGSATNGQDFSPPWNSSISFGANQGSATVLIPIADDADIEGTENFLLSLGNPSTGTIGAQSTATVEIADNDMPPVVEFETASYSVNENSSIAFFTVKRAGDTSLGTNVEVQLVEGTANLSDLNSPSNPISLGFAPGKDSVTFSIEIYDDGQIEETENLTLLLANPSGGSIGAQSAANLEIIDNDGPPIVEFDAASYSATENGGAATIEVKRSGDIGSGFNLVHLSLSNGSATSGSDFYIPINNTVDFAPGQSSATAVVPITDDVDIEGTEDLTLELLNSSGGNYIGAQGTATLEIVDNDGPSVVEFSAASYSVAENGGFATINLTREGDTNNPSTVELLLSSGSATDGTDFNNPASSFINFTANQTSATVYVPILEDANVEGTEDLTLELVNPSGGTNIGAQGAATLEIVDNDGPSEIQFAAASYSANENGGFATINVMRSGDASSSSSVEVVVSAGSATSNVDFQPPAASSINFAVNQTSASVVIPIINDTDSEGLENLSLELTNPSGSSLGSQNTATLEIVDDENDPPAIALPGTALDYIENSVPAVIDSSATVVDVDSPNFDGGTLTVSFSSGGTADDRLSIEYSSQIGLSGSDVIYEGTPIGSFSGGSGVADLVVNFNASSTPAAVQELVRNIAYENVSENPIANRMVEFILTDGDGGTSSAVTQTVRVQGTNDAPAVSPVNISGDEDTDIAFTAADFTGAFSDIDGDSLAKVKIASLSADGNLKLNGTAVTLNQEINAADLGNLTFTPAVNFSGSTSFDWNGSDGSDYSPAAAAVNLTVNPVNDAPTVSTVSLSAAEDTDIAFTAADFSDGFGDPEDDSLAKIKITSLPDSGTLALSGTEVVANQEIDAADLGNLVFTPTANFTGTTSFAWNGYDGSSYAAADAEVILAIAVSNDSPEVSNVSLSQDEDTDLALTAADFTNAFSDLDGDSLVKIKITSLPDSGTLALSDGLRPGSARTVVANQEIDAADLGNLVFTPTANFNGSTSFGWNGFDGIAYAADEATVSVTVNPINDAPVLETVTISGDEDAAIGFSSENFSSNFSDAEGDSLAKVKITSLPADGTLTLDGTAVSENLEIEPSELGNLVFTPAANFNGSASFGWNGSDGIAYAAAEGTVAVTVNPLADLPTVSNLLGLSGDEDANIALSSQDFSANFSDPDGDRLAKIKITSLPENGSLKLDGTAVTLDLEIDAADLDNLVFAPGANWNGSTSFGWNGSDGTGYAETEATANLTVNAVNDAPIAGAIASQSTLKNQSFEFQFSENVFSDAEGDPLSYSAATPAWLSFDPGSRTFSGTPSSSDIGTQVIEVTASDGQETASTSFELTVANSSPTVANAIASQSAIFNHSFQFQVAENIFSDRDGDSLSYSAATPAWLSFDPSSRTFSGTPSSSDAGTQVIEVTASDGQDTASTTFELTVNEFNNPPVVASSVFYQNLGSHNGSQFSFAADTYVDPDPGDTITYSIALANTLSYSWYDWATATNGRGYRKAKEGVVFPEVEMPSWLSFDPETRTVTIDEANRPNRFRYGVKVTGTDSSGESVSEFIWFKSSALGGFIIDNYIAGATVFWDANKNGIQDAGEPSTTSDQTGEFDLDVAIEDYDANNNGILDPAEGQIVAFGGIDTATGLPLETPVTATPEATVVTLLTTLVADLVDKGLTVNEANERVAAALSIPSGVDLNSLDPIAATENNESGGTETLTAMVKVQNAITQIASLVDGASNAEFNAIVGNVVEAITSQIQPGVTLDVSDPQVLETIIKDAAEETQQEDPSLDLVRLEAIATQAAQVMAESNQQIDAAVASGASGATLTASIANVQKVTLGDVTQELEDAAQGTKEIAQVVAENTGSALEAKINPLTAPVSNTPLLPSVPTLGANIELVRNDATEGTDGDDTYIGSDRDNSYLAYSGNDILFGNSGNDWMNGNRGDDSLDGGEGDDTLYGGKNNDTLSGNNGADVIFGNRGNDTLFGNDGDDFLNGNQAEDELFGGDGNDMLHGGKQNDILTGGDGSDTLSGDLGNDILTGGDGSDWFVLKQGYGSDILTDFEEGQDFLALANGLTFGQLAISKENGTTFIRVEEELLATLENVDASLINSGDFIGVV